MGLPGGNAPLVPGQPPTNETILNMMGLLQQQMNALKAVVDALPAMQQQNQPVELVLGTNGSMFPVKEKSTTADSDLCSAVKKQFMKLKPVDIALQFYLLARGKSNIPVPTAWDRLSNLLSRVATSESQELLAFHGAIQIDKKENWEEVMGRLLRAADPDMTDASILRRFKQVPFRSAKSYQIQMEAVETLAALLKITPPSDSELSTIVLEAIRKADATAEPAMRTRYQLWKATESSGSAMNPNVLRGLPWKEIVHLMYEVERQRAVEKEGAGDSQSYPSLTLGDRNRNKKKKKRKRGEGKPADSDQTKKPKLDKKVKDGGTVCSKCNSEEHKSKECWILSAKSPVKCNKCKKEGHIAVACRSKPNPTPKQGKGQGKGGGGTNKNQKKTSKKVSKKSASDSDSDSSSEDSHLAMLQLSADDPKGLKKALKERQDSYEEFLISSAKVKKPELPARIGSLQLMAIADTGTKVDLIDSKIVSELKKNQEECRVQSCSLGVKAAGGSRLTTRGRVFLPVDLGQGVKIRSLFVIVENLGVDMLLGVWTLTSIGTRIILELPEPYIAMKVPGQQGKVAKFPIDTDTALLIHAYRQQYEYSAYLAIQEAEAPASENGTVFGMRGEVKEQNSL